MANAKQAFTQLRQAFTNTIIFHHFNPECEIWIKTHNNEFLAIVIAIQILWHYLEGFKYEVIVFINYNNFCHFMDIKNLSFYQVW